MKNMNKTDYHILEKKNEMPPEFGRKWVTECLNTGFPLFTLLCAGYSVKKKTAAQI